MSNPTKPIDKNKIDVAQAFLIFMATVGDCARTAVALDLEPEQVEELAEAEGWNAKIRRVSLMSKGGKPGDWERAQNRALCFVQAQCIRAQVDRLLKECTELSNEELLSRCCVRTRDGSAQLSAKFMVDLAGAAEACHRMSYQALGDTVTERTENGNSDGPNKAGDLHSAIIAALSNPAAIVPNTTLLLEEANSRTCATERKSSEQTEVESDQA